MALQYRTARQQRIGQASVESLTLYSKSILYKVRVFLSLGAVSNALMTSLLQAPRNSPRWLLTSRLPCTRSA